MNPLKGLFRFWIPCIIVMVAACIEPYDPPATKDLRDFLVIDGFLNTTAGTARIIIKHTIPLASDSVPPVEDGAAVQIKSEHGDLISLAETQPGYYEQSNISYQLEEKYYVYIKTKIDKAYVSLPISLQQTPEIDSLTWKIENDQLEIYVNTHDLATNSRYYKWNAMETYRYHSNFVSSLILKPNQVVVERRDADQIYNCWKEQPLYHTMIGSTTNLRDNIVSKKVLLTIPKGSLKTTNRYRISVQQQSLTEESYLYWKEIQQTSEELGGLFDPLPGQVIGNIQCVTNPDEPVIGFISGGNLTEKLLYIDADELPREFKMFSQDCYMDTLNIDRISEASGPNSLIGPIYAGPTLIGYFTSSLQCIDCRILGGGSTQKPNYWIE
jgi:hypothetical protein